MSIVEYRSTPSHKYYMNKSKDTVAFAFKPTKFILDFLSKEFSDDDELHKVMSNGLRMIIIECLVVGGNKFNVLPYIGVIGKEENGMLTGITGQQSKELYLIFAKAFGAIISSSMFLSTKYAEKTKHVAKNSKLNIKRLQKNKKHDYYTVTINHKMVEGAESTGTGTKKRPHWRRGHIRHLPSGKVVPVMPCLINFSGEDVDKKVYISNESNEMKSIANQINLEKQSENKLIGNCPL